MPTKPKNKLACLQLLGSIRSTVKDITAASITAAQTIADLAEPPLCEFESSAMLERLLAENGFTVTRPWPKLPTGFLAVAGSGNPTIALMAEYDALPDCGPQPGLWGHGCGHNLLGVAAAMAGIAAARALKQSGKKGKVLVIGTPAEETLGGKVYLAAQGAFKGLDAVLAWHPEATTYSDIAGGQAMDSLLFQFQGRTAHAAAMPYEGRSAIDAAVLMDVAVNFLREHVQENARMHSVITEGGKAPNVVPDFAEIWYFIRGQNRAQVDDLRRRVMLCAQGAATATETRWTMVVNTSNTERIPNQPLADLLDALLRRLGPMKVSPADVRQARKILPKAQYETDIKPIKTTITRASSDEDNVSWFAPLGRASITCVPKQTILHHRQWAQMARMGGAHKGMVLAAETLAAGVVELCVNPALLRSAKADFRRNIKGKKYDLPMPPDAEPAGYHTVKSKVKI